MSQHGRSRGRCRQARIRGTTCRTTANGSLTESARRKDGEVVIRSTQTQGIQIPRRFRIRNLTPRSIPRVRLHGEAASPSGFDRWDQPSPMVLGRRPKPAVLVNLANGNKAEFEGIRRLPSPVKRRRTSLLKSSGDGTRLPQAATSVARTATGNELNLATSPTSVSTRRAACWRCSSI